MVLEDTRLGFTATQCLNPPPQKFVTGIPFRLIKHDTPLIHSQFTIIHTDSTFLPLLPHQWCSSILFILHIPHAHLSHPHFNCTSPQSVNLTSLSVSSIPLPPGYCGSLEDNRQVAWPWCALIGCCTVISQD